jgi:hypothetical protein
MMTPEQFAAANQVQLDALVELTRKSFEGVETLVALNLQAVRATLALVSAPEGLRQPDTLGRQVYEIASSTQTEASRLVEAQMAAAQEKILALIDVAVKNAPAGGEGTLAMVKQAVITGNDALQNVQQAARQVVSVAEENFRKFSPPG